VHLEVETELMDLEEEEVEDIIQITVLEDVAEMVEMVIVMYGLMLKRHRWMYCIIKGNF
jgi:hypothetical protein